MSGRKAEQNALVAQLTADRLEFELRKVANLTDATEEKAFAASQAQAISDFDQRHGLADVRYAEFRAAFDAGMGCAELFSLRNGMHPKDLLKKDAHSDLQSVRCFHRSALRENPK